MLEVLKPPKSPKKREKEPGHGGECSVDRGLRITNLKPKLKLRPGVAVHTCVPRI